MTDEDRSAMQAMMDAMAQTIVVQIGAQVKGVQQEINDLEGRTMQEIKALRQEIKALEERTLHAIKAAEERSEETARNMQTEMLRGLEAFSRGNFARMRRLESSDIDLNDRISALEERVLMLETRPPR